MKKLLLLFIVLAQTAMFAQNKHTIEKPLKLSKAERGVKNDSLLVWQGLTGLVKHLPISEIKTNLDYLATPTDGTVFSSTGNDAVVPLVTRINAGLLSPEDKIKLDSLSLDKIKSDWNAISGEAQILNKPTIPSIAGLATTVYVDSQDALKVDKVTGKSLLSDAEIARLATLANYTHPANHPPSIITQDASNRFVTDAEKEAWNAKQSALEYTAENSANKNTADGYAGLGWDGKLISSQLPSITISDTFVTASQAGMLAVTAETGDVAVRTDLNKSFILKGTNPAVLGDWQELLTPTSEVTTVFGRNGAITAQTGDYTATMVGAPAGSGTSTGANTGDNATNSQYSSLVTNQTHTGDATGSTTLTLATVNSNVGTFGNASNVAQSTVNAKGLTTEISNVPIQIAESQVTGLVSDLAGKAPLNGTGTTGTWPIGISGNSATTNAVAVTNQTTGGGGYLIPFVANGSGYSSLTVNSPTLNYNIGANTIGSNISGNATTATKWLAPIALTIGNTFKAVDGTTNVAWSLSEIGVPSLTGIGATGTWPINISGNAPSWGGNSYNGTTATDLDYFLSTKDGQGDWRPVPISLTKTKLGINNGSTLANSITGNAVSATTAEKASNVYNDAAYGGVGGFINPSSMHVRQANLWNGYAIEPIIYNGTGIMQIPVWNSDASKFQFSNPSTIKSWLGLGSNAYSSTAYQPLDGYIYTFKGSISNNINADELTANGIYLNVTGNGTGNVNFPTGYSMFSVLGNNSSYGQVQHDYQSDGTQMVRVRYGGGFSGWRKVWDDVNFNPASYLPLTGGLVSGDLFVNSKIEGGNTGNYNNYIGTVSLGRSGNGYPLIGNNINYTATSNNYTYKTNDTSWALDFGNSNSFRLRYGNGTAGSTIAYTDFITVNTSGYMTSYGGFFNSDRRLKTILKRDGEVAYFKWKDKRDTKTHIGYIAQEVKKEFPDQVQKGEDGMLSVNYIEVLVAKIQDLEKRLIKSEKQNVWQTKKIKQLQRKK